MAVPRYISGKASGLTRGEHEIVRKHPMLVKEILRRFEGLPPQMMSVCLHHHERFDGGRYPHGLLGDAIPFSARLASICDVYDALTTIRPYKKAWTQAEAIESMLNSFGQFDSRLLGRFVSKAILSAHAG